MQKTVSIIILCGLFLFGCERVKEVNQELRHEYFVECLKIVPKGPESTKYNDWDDVVSECGTQAYYMALR